MDDHFASMRRRNLAASTIQQRRYVIRRLARHIGRPAIEATADEVRDFIDRLELPESRATEISHLRSYYAWALRQGQRNDDPTRHLERPRLGRRLPRPMPDDDLARALDQSEDRVRAWLHLAAFAGLRACELGRLRAENVLLSSNPPMLVVEGKGSKMRAVPVHDALVPILLTLPRSGWCFPRRDGRPGPVPAHGVSHGVNRYLRGIGVAHTLHTVRHWFATETYRATRNLRVVQELLGHETPTTTQVYTWVDPGAAVEAVNAIRPPAA